MATLAAPSVRGSVGRFRAWRAMLPARSSTSLASASRRSRSVLASCLGAEFEQARGGHLDPLPAFASDALPQPSERGAQATAQDGDEVDPALVALDEGLLLALVVVDRAGMDGNAGTGGVGGVLVVRRGDILGRRHALGQGGNASRKGAGSPPRPRCAPSRRAPSAGRTCRRSRHPPWGGGDCRRNSAAGTVTDCRRGQRASTAAVSATPKKRNLVIHARRAYEIDDPPRGRGSRCGHQHHPVDAPIAERRR
jgi:hypothetical protein